MADTSDVPIGNEFVPGAVKARYAQVVNDMKNRPELMPLFLHPPYDYNQIAAVLMYLILVKLEESQ